MIAGSDEAIMMVESGALEVSEETVVEALEFGHAQVKKIVAAIKQLHAQLKPKKVEVAPWPFDQSIYDAIKKTYGAALKDALDTEKHPKKESYHLIDELKAKIVEAVPEEDEEKLALTKRAFDRLKEDIFRDEILNNRRRPDGRAFDKIRKITCEVGLLPRVHGSALFTRGETQALATLTLGTKEDQQRLDLLFAARPAQALHAALQLSAVQRWRSEAGAWPGTSRNRSRRVGRARVGQLAAAGDGISVRHAVGQRHSGIQWVIFDGHGLRRLAGHDGRGRSAQVPLRRYRHGPGRR